MTAPLFKTLTNRIQEFGPVTIAEYMTEALHHPEHGYYNQEQVFGREGDFITAPEVSQCFGEMLAVSIIHHIQEFKPEGQIDIIELGPGRGTLLADMLRITKQIAPDIYKRLSIHLIENSKTLTEQQAETLKEHTEIGLNWYRIFNDYAKDAAHYAFVIGNEFFDALPIHQYQRSIEHDWLERYVDFDKDKDQLFYTTSKVPEEMLQAFPDILREKSKAGEVLEFCPLAVHFMADIASHLRECGGVGIFFDYGYLTTQTGETFQALKNHQYHDPLVEPGTADLTAHVNFEALGAAAMAAGCHVAGMGEQGEFLKSLGIEARFEMLMKMADDEQKSQLKNDLHRLTDPEEMGSLFKTLIICDQDIRYIGFHDAE